jgi:hypothetical protein
MIKQTLGHYRVLEKIGAGGSRGESSVTVSQCDAGRWQLRHVFLYPLSPKVLLRSIWSWPADSQPRLEHL